MTAARGDASERKEDQVCGTPALAYQTTRKTRASGQRAFAEGGHRSVAAAETERFRKASVLRSPLG